MAIRFLQVVLDDMSFFDSVVGRFESDNRLSVRNVLIVDKKDYKFQHIKKTEKVELLWSDRMVQDFFTKGDYDVVYLYTLIPSRWKLFRYIPSDKKIIWWAWGWDLYESFYGLKPLIGIELFKPETKRVLTNNVDIRNILKWLFFFFIKPVYNLKRKNVLRRIDYFHPVIVEEYKLMIKLHPEFHAKLFFRPTTTREQRQFSEKDKDGNILFGNSSTLSNNHLDVWHFINKVQLFNQTIVIPLSYGDMNYGDMVQQTIGEQCTKARFLREMVEIREYAEMTKTCSYAVFGVLRQQAMGTINRCIRQGVKIFLFKDSMNYKFLKSIGVEVFAIEDIDASSFQTPLTIEQQTKNYNALFDFIRYKNDIYDKLVSGSFELK